MKPVKKTQVLMAQTVKRLSYEAVKKAVDTLLYEGYRFTPEEKDYLLNKYPSLKEELYSRVG